MRFLLLNFLNIISKTETCSLRFLRRVLFPKINLFFKKFLNTGNINFDNFIKVCYYSKFFLHFNDKTKRSERRKVDKLCPICDV